MNYGWYPGHMTKARRMMQEDCKLVDIIIELVDARAPLSSRNPDIDAIGQGKERVIILNKADLSDPDFLDGWVSFFEHKGMFVVSADARNKSDLKKIRLKIDEAALKKRERDKKRGIINRPVRAMVAGIPNVGKSTFINTFAGKACTKTGNRPGVTRGKQWIKLAKTVELLDTPGILWPKFEDELVGQRLAMLGSIREEILQEEELSYRIIDFMKENYPGRLSDRYSVDEKADTCDILDQIAKNRGCIKKGDEADHRKAALIVMDEFRNGALGRLSLETPKEGFLDDN